MHKTLITGAAGLLGQNLTAELAERRNTDITAIDKHERNLETLKKLHPNVRCVCADLSERGEWEKEFSGVDRLFLLQAQITGDNFEIFRKNTLESTANVIRAAEANAVPFTVLTGSSVVHSVANDNYTRSKRAQEELVNASSLKHCITLPMGLCMTSSVRRMSIILISFAR